MRRNVCGDAAVFLRELLASEQFIPSVDVYRLAKNAGFGVRTIKKVKKELGIQSVRVNNQWYFKKSELN